MITACILTMSDRGFNGQREDLCAPLIEEMLTGIGAVVNSREILPDELEMIKEKLIGYSGRVDLIVTTGGTGLSPRDVTPEATLAVIGREVPGMAEAMRAEGMRATRRAMLSRAVAGVRGGTLIVNLPGSPRAVRECLGAVLDAIPHAVEKIKGSDKECARDV
jgi:molybdenum cofactor synthesis domain-containing protein